MKYKINIFIEEQRIKNNRKILKISNSHKIINNIQTTENNNKYGNIITNNSDKENTYFTTKKNNLTTNSNNNMPYFTTNFNNSTNITETNNNELKGYIPSKTKLLNYKLEDDHLILNFSKDIKNVSNEKQLITGITYSLLELDNINYVSFLIEKIPWKNYTKLSKNIGINNEYLLTSIKDTNKVVIYYLDNTNTYYVPVTKYLNDKREKIEIIVDELKRTKKGLISYIPEKVKLINYREEENILFLNFNEYLKDSCKDSSEKILNTISYSVFDNYNVNMVVFEIEDKKYQYIYKNKKTIDQQ